MAVGQYKASNNDQLTVVDGLKVGAVVGVIAGVLLGIYNVLYTTVIALDYYDKVMDLTIDAFSPMIDKMTESQAEEFYDKLVNSKPTRRKPFQWQRRFRVLLRPIRRLPARLLFSPSPCCGQTAARRKFFDWKF